MDKVAIYKNVCKSLIAKRKKIILEKLSHQKIERPSDILEALLINQKNSENMKDSD